MEITKCKNCKKEILNKYPSRIKQFCSHECANIFNNAKRRGTYIVERIDRNCEYCGKKLLITESLIQKRIKEGYEVKYCSQRCSGLSKRTRKVENCLNCGIEFETTRAKCCGDKCAREYRVKSGSMKKSGYWFENGYKVLYVEGDKKIKEHINNMEIHIGRKLEKNEVVHHINGNRLDNRIENLKLMTRSEHSSLHRKLEIKSGKQLFGKEKI